MRNVVCTVAWSVLLGACAAPDAKVAAVSSLDLGRYDGRWYDVASYPQSFQEGCTCTSATYTLRDDGEVDVVNRCNRDSPRGEIVLATGRAWRPDEAAPAKLKVSFFWPFAGDYWVIDLRGDDDDGDYRLAVVSDPQQKTLWVLSRDRMPDAAELDDVRANLADLGYDLGRLAPVVQDGCSDEDG